MLTYADVCRPLSHTHHSLAHAAGSTKVQILTLYLYKSTNTDIEAAAQGGGDDYDMCHDSCSREFAPPRQSSGGSPRTGSSIFGFLEVRPTVLLPLLVQKYKY
jgi:hypothetical protein